MAERAVAVALLGRADDARAQLRIALDELGASVVVEADPSKVAVETISAGRPDVVLVNLDPALEDALDHLQPLFDDPGVRVVFNEAEVSSQLSGWDRARWARHLAAKLLGHGQTMPPPPPGAEVLPSLNLMPSPGAPPSPAQITGDVAIERFAAEAEGSAGEVPAEPRLEDLVVSDGFQEAMEDRAVEQAEPIPDAFDLDLGEIADALSTSAPKPEVEGARVPDAAPEAGEEFSYDFDPASLDLVEDEPVDLAARPPQAPDASRAGSPIGDDGGLLELDDLDQAVAQDIGLDLEAVGGDAEPALSATDEDLFEGLDLEPASEAETGFSIDASEPLELAAGDAELNEADTVADAIDTIEFGDEPDFEADEDFAKLAAAFDAGLETAPEAGPGEAQDFDFLELAEPEAEAVAFAPEPVAAPQATPPPVESGASGRGFDFGDLSLEPMSEGEAPSAPRGSAAASAKSAGSAPSFDFDSLGLSLEPLDEPAEAAATAAAPAGKSTLDLSEPPVASAGTGRIERVVVLGASIGGPDALRSFLAEIPADFPALFLLAQHLDSGFFEKLAEQLQKVSKLPVRLPTDGMRLGPGEILVVSAGDRVLVDRQGNLRLEPHQVRPAYSPSIDTVLRDVADAFGARALAIIFSGMAGDAIEGAAHLASRGGEVWVQDPASCVVSSMVDGISSRGLAEVVASPRELARQLVERFSRPA